MVSDYLKLKNYTKVLSLRSLQQQTNFSAMLICAMALQYFRN